MKIRILNFLFRLLPWAWITVDKHNQIIDEFLLDCMAKDEYFTPGFMTHTVRNKEIWTENYPYGYGGFYTRSGPKDRCGSYVAWKLRRYLKNQENVRLRNELFGDN